MDLLFKRYASPFLLLDGIIQTSRLCEYMGVLIDQKKEDELYEYYLHKVWDKSYPDFRNELQTAQELHEMSESDIEATIKESISILGNFNPETKVGEV